MWLETYLEKLHTMLLLDKAGLMNELSESTAFGHHRDENVSKCISQSPNSNSDKKKKKLLELFCCQNTFNRFANG